MSQSNSSAIFSLLGKFNVNAAFRLRLFILPGKTDQSVRHDFQKFSGVAVAVFVPSADLEVPSGRGGEPAGEESRIGPRGVRSFYPRSDGSGDGHGQILIRRFCIYQRISCSMVVTAAGSSGKMTGSSLVRTVRSPTRFTITFTGQPQAL